MTHEEFMKLPLESRKRIEEKIVDLDIAVQREYGFSMIAEEVGSEGQSRPKTKATRKLGRSGHNVNKRSMG